MLVMYCRLWLVQYLITARLIIHSVLLGSRVNFEGLHMDSAAQNFQPRTFSIKLWPPSESTRLMLVERMTKNLSTESIFSRKYGLLGKEEAHENAKGIEELCFTLADEHFKREPDGDGKGNEQDDVGSS